MLHRAASVRIAMHAKAFHQLNPVDGLLAEGMYAVKAYGHDGAGHGMGDLHL